jgi:hypothetical protein
MVFDQVSVTTRTYAIPQGWSYCGRPRYGRGWPIMSAESAPGTDSPSWHLPPAASDRGLSKALVAPRVNPTPISPAFMLPAYVLSPLITEPRGTRGSKEGICTEVPTMAQAHYSVPPSPGTSKTMCPFPHCFSFHHLPREHEDGVSPNDDRTRRMTAACPNVRYGINTMPFCYSRRNPFSLPRKNPRPIARRLAGRERTSQGAGIPSFRGATREGTLFPGAERVTMGGVIIMGKAAASGRIDMRDSGRCANGNHGKFGAAITPNPNPKPKAEVSCARCPRLLGPAAP